MAPGGWTFDIDGTAVSVHVRPRLHVTTSEAAIAAAIAGLGLTRVLCYQIATPRQKRVLEAVLGKFEPYPCPLASPTRRRDCSRSSYAPFSISPRQSYTHRCSKVRDFGERGREVDHHHERQPGLLGRMSLLVLTQGMRDAGQSANDIDMIQAWAGQSARLAPAEPAAE